MPFHDGLTAGPCSEERGDHAQPRHADEQPKGQRLLRPEQKCQRSGDHDQRRREEDQEQRGSPIGLDGFGPLPQLRLCGGVKGVLFQSFLGLQRGLRGLLRGAALFRQGGQLTGKCGGLPLQQRQRSIVRQGGASRPPACRPGPGRSVPPAPPADRRRPAPEQPAPATGPSAAAGRPARRSRASSSRRDCCAWSFSASSSASAARSWSVSRSRAGMSPVLLCLRRFSAFSGGHRTRCRRCPPHRW